MSALAVVLALAALPEGAARYRAELGGEPVGVAELRVRCGTSACEVSYDSRLRLPAESGGAVVRRRVEVEVDRTGRWRGGALRAGRGEAVPGAARAPGAVPAAALELVLAAEAEDRETCLTFFDEQDGTVRTACARRDGPDRTVVDAGGVREAIVSGADGFPERVEVGERFRFVRDAGAEVPARAPRLAGTRVGGPDDPARARAFCGVPRDAEAAAPRAALPPPRAAGESCREKTDAWLAAARARGLEGRTAVGVAWDGAAFVWHAWAEVRSGASWVPVDPSFGELPARGPRFTLGRYGRGDRRARDEAGARILACWGTARVEDR